MIISMIAFRVNYMLLPLVVYYAVTNLNLSFISQNTLKLVKIAPEERNYKLLLIVLQNKIHIKSIYI